MCPVLKDAAVQVVGHADVQSASGRALQDVYLKVVFAHLQRKHKVPFDPAQGRLSTAHDPSLRYRSCSARDDREYGICHWKNAVTSVTTYASLPDSGEIGRAEAVLLRGRGHPSTSLRAGPRHKLHGPHITVGGARLPCSRRTWNSCDVGRVGGGPGF
jgi:hypothetical protein